MTRNTKALDSVLRPVAGELDDYSRIKKSHKRKEYLDRLNANDRRRILDAMWDIENSPTVRKRIESLIYRGQATSKIVGDPMLQQLPARRRKGLVKEIAKKRVVAFDIDIPLFQINSYIRNTPNYQIIHGLFLRKINHQDPRAIADYLKQVLGPCAHSYDLARLKNIYVKLTRKTTVERMGDQSQLDKNNINWHITSGNNEINRTKGFSPEGVSLFGFKELSHAKNWVNSLTPLLVWREGYVFKIQGIKGSFAITNRDRQLPKDHVREGRRFRIYPGHCPIDRRQTYSQN